MIQKEINYLPDGYLTKKGIYYYQKIGNIQKGITKNPLLIRSLARKALLLKQLQNFQSNLVLAKKFVPQLRVEDSMTIIQELPSAYKLLPLNYFFPSSVHSWHEKEFCGNIIHKNELIYLTNAGIRVRSKSERTIANELEKNGIPYHYEHPIAFGGEVKYPDFTIKTPHNGITVLWEHFGLMDNNEYREKMIKKLSFYATHGFLPYVNLICTYEQDIRNVGKIQELIRLYCS